MIGNSACLSQSMMGSVKGFTEPYFSIDVATSESGTLAEVTVEEGQHVETNAILARINEKVLQAALNIVNESVNSKGKLNSALAEWRMQQQKLERIEGLFARKHASQNELDRARSQLEIAQAHVESAQDELRVKVMEAQKIEAQLELRRLRSPIDGIVTRIFKEQGEFVSANEPTVLRIVQLDPLKVVFSIPRKIAIRYTAGDRVKVVVGSDGELAPGLIEFVSPTADAQSGTCRVKVRIDNPELKWPSGVECRLESEQFAKSSNHPKLKQSSIKRSSSPLPRGQ